MNKTTIIALATVVILAVIFFIVAGETDKEELKSLSVPGVKLDDDKDKPDKDENAEAATEIPEDEKPTVGPADKITIERKGVKTVLVKEDKDTWRITEPVQALAETYRIRGMLRAFEKPMKSNYSREISEAAMAKLDFSEESRIRATLMQGETTLIDLYIGRVDKSEEMSSDADTMVMVPDQGQVYYRLPGQDLRRPFDVEMKDLRNKKVFEFTKDDVIKVVINDPRAGQKPELAFAKGEGDVWKLTKPTNVEVENLGGFISSLANTRAEEFMTELPGADAAALGKAYKITATVKKGEQEETVSLSLGAGRKKGVYARVDGRDGVFLVGTYAAKQLMKSLSDFRKKKLFTFKPEDLAEITIEGPENPRLHLKKEAEEWTFVEPAGMMASSTKVKSVASGISNFRAGEFLDKRPSADESGLGAAALKVSVKLAKAAGEGTSTILIGKEFKNAEDQERYYAQLEGDSEVFAIMKYSRDNITKGIDDLRDKRVFRMSKDDIVELSLKHPDQTLNFVVADKDGKKSWKMTAPKEKDDVQLTTILSTVTSLDVDKVETNRTPTEVGLIGGEAFTVSFKLKNGSEHSITFSEEVEDNKSFAMTASESELLGKVLLISKYKVQNLTKKLPDFENKPKPPGPPGMPPGMAPGMPPGM
jgi:hypothetical protein